MIGHIERGYHLDREIYDRLREFYCQTLGLQPHSDRPHFVSFKWGGLRFSIGSHDHVRGQARDPHRIMVNFDIEDIHAFHRDDDR